MITLAAADLEERLPWPTLIDALAETLREARVVSPERQVLPIALDGGESASLLLMPAWIGGEAIGVKAVTFFPANNRRGRATINAVYLLFDGADGSLRAVCDGDALTARRTAAASALAARYLARAQVRRLLVVGTGHLSMAVAEAHATVRRYREVLIWGRDGAKAHKVACALEAKGLPARVATSLEVGCADADVICSVTNATRPLIRGAWLRPGVHLDLIGSFREDMRESDDDAIRRSSIFVDTAAGACLAGDLAQPLASGLISRDAIEADLAELVRKRHPGRRSEKEITLFKSAGFALEDLAAASLAEAWNDAGLDP